AAMEGIMSGQWTPAQIGAYLTALHIKGESTDEITGAAVVMRAKAFRQEVQRRPLVDTAGSGGDALQTINVSTLAALVAAGAGVSMAKHGNRAITGQCGSADILEGLGVELDISPADAVAGIDVNGFGFLFAPHFHQSMKFAAGPRREIGVPSIFNYLGPLTNPLGAEAQLIGVNNPLNTRRFAEVLAGLGCRHALLVHGSDGMDEITLTGETQAVELQDGAIEETVLTPEAFGLKRVALAELRLPDKDTAVQFGRAFLHGEAPRAQEELVLVNAAAAIYLGAKAGSIVAALPLARASLRGGAALGVLERVVAYTRAHKAAPAP
ncbi:MAG: anthranilate phosphoribosyltransferase, partial [Candidatus Lambdaproteobacteria bacterium]|nr:anthranilate phosphoribosyltransferase [Candidatus Lambdaproteobacteria bacterium]